MSVETLAAMPFGASILARGGVRFRLFAPSARRVALEIESPAAARYELERDADGFFELEIPGAEAGTRYAYDIDGLRAPDPASRFAPAGVHGPSVVVDPAAYVWRSEAWRGRPWHETIFYEIHIGTFTPGGTFAAARERLPELVALGVTALELMPLAQAPGARNWGYDGVLLYAPSHNYGTPDDLRAFVDAAHELELAVYLDVVYNHFGPEGNYLHAYAPEFYTQRHTTPWGPAIDVASRDRSHVRAFFIENARYWLREYRLDGLRLDAVHAIHDGDERAFLRELATVARADARHLVHLVVENEANETALLESGFDAQWNDDAHHAAHVLGTGERDGYYGDYALEPLEMLGRTLTAGFAYVGQASAFRNGTPRGERSDHLALTSFVNFVQNHDQIGNRAFGERIATLAPRAALHALVATMLLAPPIPMLFMGEEWAASSPFLYFCDFEPDLARAVTAGRRAEFGAFASFAADAGGAGHAPTATIPDPADPATFARSLLRWDERARAPHADWLAFYRELLALRAREIVPRIARVRGNDARFETFGAAHLHATWNLDDGTTLHLEANLGAGEGAGFAATPVGRVLYATHATPYAGGIAPPWSVRWSLA